MLKNIIKFLGGYTADEYKNHLEAIPKEDFKVGDTVFFYYVSRGDYQNSSYYQAKIKKIKTVDRGDLKVNSFILDTSELKHKFVDDFSIKEDHISKSLIGLRNKIMNSKSYTFLTFMPYENIENINE